MDCIHLSNIRVYGYTGVLPEEKTLGQWFEVDLTLWLDLSTPSVSDRLEDTYDYRSAIEQVQALVKTQSFDLIERLAGAIANIFLESGIEQVRVRLTKMHAPIPDFGGRVTVDITRSAT